MLSGCEFQQDPISGAPEAVRTGTPPNMSKPEIPEAFPKEALQIDAPNIVSGRIGLPIELTIGYRVMVEGVEAQVQIDNLEEFVGAEFDSATGVFKWTPTRDAVGSFTEVELPLQVTLMTIPSDAYPKVSVEKKKVTILVMNSYSRPLVASLVGEASVSVGFKYIYKMVVDDLDALSRHDVSVVQRNCANYRSDISTYVSIGTPVADLNSAGKYLVDVTLDLTGGRATEVPNGSYCFGLVAISKYGQVSPLFTKDVTVVGIYKATNITADTFDVKMGSKLNVSFSVYEPTGNATVTINSITDVASLLPGSSIACKTSATTPSIINCAGVIDATNAVQEKRHSVVIDTTTSARGTTRLPMNSKHTINIFVSKSGGK